MADRLTYVGWKIVMAHVCVVTLDPHQVGGVQTRLVSFLHYAASRGHVCDIFFPSTTADPGWQAERLRDIPSVRDLRAVRVNEHLPHFGRVTQFTRRWPLDRDYDLNLLIAGSLNLGLAFARRNKPFVAWIAGTFNAEVSAMPRTSLHHYYLYNRYSNHRTWLQELEAGSAATTVLAVSRYSALNLRRDLGVSESKIRVVPGPVDTKLFRPGEAVLHPRPYVLSVSRLQRGKGFPTLFRAFRIVANQFPELELRVVGDGKSVGKLTRLVRRLGLERQVFFAGELHGRRLVEQYRGASLFAFASRQEALGNVVAEALSTGLPLVSTDCGGVRDLVVRGKTGLLVPVDDHVSLARSMVALLSDSTVAADMGRAGRTKVLAEYSTPVIGRKLDFILGGGTSCRSSWANDHAAIGHDETAQATA